jgi:hypothetical protein
LVLDSGGQIQEIQEAQQWIPIHWIRHFKWIRIPRTGFWWPITEEKKIQQKFFLYLFWSKIAIYWCPSLQTSKDNIQHFKKWDFLPFFLCLWVIFARLDRIRIFHWIPSGSTALVGGFGTQSIWLINLVFQSPVCVSIEC